MQGDHQYRNDSKIFPPLRPDINWVNRTQSLVLQKIKTSTLFLLSQCEQVYKKEFISKLSDDTWDDFNPLLFCFHESLLNRMKSQDPLKVLEVLDLYIPYFKCNKKNHSPTAQILNLGQDFLSKCSKDLFLSGVDYQERFESLTKSKYIEEESRCKKEIHRLKEQLPEYEQEMSLMVKHIWLCDGPDFKGISSLKFLGGIFLSTTNPLSVSDGYYIEWLVHECAHMLLHMALTQDKLIQNHLSELYRSPLRKDPRPLVQILHAAFVLIRSIQALEKLNQVELQARIQYLKYDYQECIKILSQNAIWTEEGKAFFNSLSNVSFVS